MAKKGKKHQKQSGEILENPEVLASEFVKTEEFIEKHKVAVFTAIGVVALIISGLFVYQYYIDTQNELAQNEMFQAVYYFEQDSLDLALRGDGNHYGFLDIIEEYGATDAGNLANFYAGAIYMQKGNFSSAVPFLKDFSVDDIMLQARAYSLLGDVSMEEKDYETAADYFTRAADYKPNQYFTPVYLMKAGLAYELLEEYSKASEQYSIVIKKYKKSSEYDKARKYKARLDALS
jgi:tetratricopeptide (TPR) repeat protein